MVYVCAKLCNFSSLHGRDPPPPFGCEMGSNDPAFGGVKVILRKVFFCFFTKKVNKKHNTGSYISKKKKKRTFESVA